MSHDGEAPQANEPQERRDVLLEEFNKVEAEATAPAETPKAGTPEQAPPGHNRDENGRFLAKEKAAAPTAVPASVPGAQPEPAALEPWQTAPKSWKKELAQGWDKLDPAYQQYVHEREQQMHQGIEPLLPKAELADKMLQAAAPYMNTIQGLGLDLPQAVAGLMNADYQLRTLPYQQKLQYIHQTLLSYGIDLSGQLQQAQETGNPYIQQMQNELLQIRGQFQQFTKAQEDAANAAALDQIQTFKKTAEHFDEVTPMIQQLLQSRVSTTLEDAYEKAIRLSPELFDKITAARQATADVEKRKAADQAAKVAKAAAVSVKSATPGAPTNTNAKDRRSILLEQFNSLSERL